MTADPWREPPEESIDLYPGVVIHDGRMSGSLTFGVTRTPLWAPTISFEDAEDYLDHYEDCAERVAAAEGFVHDLLEMRGEFARLLLVLADGERCEGRGMGRKPWWETKRHRKRVADQMRRCLAVLEPDSPQINPEGTQR